MVKLLFATTCCVMFLGSAVPACAQEGDPDTAGAQTRRALKVDPLVGLAKSQLRHPLVAPLTMAHDTLNRLDREVGDYTCVLVRRERIRGRLSSYEHIFAKVRRQQVRDGEIVIPFSIYLCFLAPARIKDREIIYVAGRNNGEMIARRGGTGNLKSLTMWLDPRGERVARSSKWPVTDFGIGRLSEMLIVAGRQALDFDLDRNECTVRNIDGAKINGRAARCTQITFPVRREHLEFHIGRIFIDEQLQLPVRLAYYTWPLDDGGKPRLMGEYNYTKIKLNVGLTDRDFDEKNPDYGFYIPRDEPTTFLSPPRTPEGSE
jgi:hypothetical protein